MSRSHEYFREHLSYEELQEREREEYFKWYLNQKNNETDNDKSSDTSGSGGLPEKPKV